MAGAGELVKAAAKLPAVPVMPGGILANVAEHLRVSSSARMPVSAMAALTPREEAIGELMPRVVFHGVPTREEAQEATSEIVELIEKMHPWSHDSDGNNRSMLVTNHESNSSLSNSQLGPVITNVNGGTTMESPASTAFQLLIREPRAQTVICSLAMDPNMFEAVRNNPEFQEFRRQCRQPSVATERLHMLPVERTGQSSQGAESQPEISFEDFFRTIQGMVDTVKIIYDFVVKLFRREGANSSADGDHGTDPTGESEHEHIMEKSILGLAIMVIMLVLVKRRI